MCQTEKESGVEGKAFADILPQFSNHWIQPRRLGCEAQHPQYPIAIEPGDDLHAFGVVVPDLPGCFSAGDTLDEAVEKSKEAISLWIETVLDDDGTVPAPGRLSDHFKNPDFSGWLWAVVEVDGALLDDNSERVNISMPRRIFIPYR